MLRLAAQPELGTPVLQLVKRVVARHPMEAAGLKADDGQGGAVTLIQRFGSTADLIMQPQYPPCASDLFV
jgi:hypothetical protein